LRIRLIIKSLAQYHSPVYSNTIPESAKVAVQEYENGGYTHPAREASLGAPHLIHNDEELATYTEALFELTSKTDTTPEEDEAIDLLTLLIERYEAEKYSVPPADPVTVLRYLMESHNLRQKDLSDVFAGEGNVSQVLSAKRDLNRITSLGSANGSMSPRRCSSADRRPPRRRHHHQ
jgi:HTH-type transcriptional regulator/antitoxin HigA